MKITNYDLYNKGREMVRSFLADTDASSDTFEAFGAIVGMVNLQRERITELETQLTPERRSENQRRIVESTQPELYEKRCTNWRKKQRRKGGAE